ncbi:MAG: outer membrane beta-barrel protein [Salinivirgaceae bacterium]|nr:outer membrane beta-barrel protein [Salinivirgaceae bacterium]
MKVKGLLVAAAAAMLCFGAQNASAIEAPNHEGDFTLNIQGGFLSEYSGGIGASVSGDYVLVNSWWKGHFTVGGFGEFNHSKDDLGWVGYDIKYTNIAVMARATYGLNITDKFEVHAGAMTGPVFHSWKYQWKDDGKKVELDDDKSVDFGGAGVAGCRFFLSDNFALTAELIAGTHLTYFNAGVSLKF